MNWITTTELERFLIAHPNIEYECRMYISSGIVSTHWWYFDSERQCFRHSHDIKYSNVSRHELLSYYKDCLWKIEQ